MSTLYVIENEIGFENLMVMGLFTIIAVVLFNKYFKLKDKDD